MLEQKPDRSAATCLATGSENADLALGIYLHGELDLVQSQR